MKLLVIGGTHFVGRAAVEDAVARGHEVTVFHRGPQEPDHFPDVEHVHGDRDGGLGAVQSRGWDAVLDTCGYVPRQIVEVESNLGAVTPHYTYISSISVYPDASIPGATEDTATYAPPFPATEDVTDASYGPLKAACEREALRAFAGRCLVVRPGYIVGPHDPTDRFPYWVRRAAAGGEMLAPAPGTEVLQLVDVRDLAAFTLDRIEAATVDVFGVVGPGEPLTWADAVATLCRLGGADTTVTWVDFAFLHEHLGDERWQALPLWDMETPGSPGFDDTKSRAAWMRHRSFETTARDTLAWDRARPPGELKAGLTPQRERDLLRGWHARGT
jgi:2'-hydroxyisoflavone reductase